MIPSPATLALFMLGSALVYVLIGYLLAWFDA